MMPFFCRKLQRIVSDGECLECFIGERANARNGFSLRGYCVKAQLGHFPGSQPVGVTPAKGGAHRRPDPPSHR